MKGQLKYQLREKGWKKPAKPLPLSLEQRLAELPTAASIVLGLVGVAGLTTIMLLAPNAMQLLGKFMYRKTGRRPKKNEIEAKFLHTVYYLKRTGKIKVGKENGSIWFKLTNHDKTSQLKLELQSISIARPNTWDKTYWLVAADVPTKTHRALAEGFRRKLMDIGFYPLQRTLWLFPYNPRIELQKLADYFDLGRFVTLMHIAEVDSQDLTLAKQYWKERSII